MDLSSLDTRKTADDGAEMQLRHPGTDAVLTQDDGKAITITLAGSDSDRYQRAQRAQANRRLNAGVRRKLTIEELESDTVELLVACTIKWDGIKVGGKVLDCTTDNARKLYRDYQWIREQANAFIGERANFLKA